MVAVLGGSWYKNGTELSVQQPSTPKSQFLFWFDSLRCHQAQGQPSSSPSLAAFGSVSARRARMRSAMPSADRCKACVDGAKRKCTCGGKVPRKRLRRDEVVNARGDPLGFAAAAAAAQRARLEPAAPMAGAGAAAGAASARVGVAGREPSVVETLVGEGYRRKIQTTTAPSSFGKYKIH